MDELELEIKINEAKEKNDNDEVIRLFEGNKNIISKKYHSLNLKYIEALFDNGNVDKSLDILQEELNMPYIPMEYEDKYRDLYSLCMNVIKNTSVDAISNFTDEQIIEEIFVKESNLSVLILKYLEDKNIRKFLSNIRDYFKDSSKENYIKVFLLDVLKKQEVNEDFEINSIIGTRVINPITHHYFDEQVVLTETFARINNDIKDVTLLAIMKEVSIGLCIGLFPFEFKLEDIDSIIAACHYYASNMLNINVDLQTLKSMYNYNEERLYLFLDILKKDYEDSGC